MRNTEIYNMLVDKQYYKLREKWIEQFESYPNYALERVIKKEKIKIKKHQLRLGAAKYQLLQWNIRRWGGSAE